MFTWKEVSKRKVSYLIGTASCFVVVWMIMVSVSALSQVPLVFIRLAELQVGEFDFKLKTGINMAGISLNYTRINLQIQNATRGNPEMTQQFSYHSPRFTFSTRAFTNCEKNQKSIQSSDYNNGQYCVPIDCKKVAERLSLYLIDTDKERRMQFGRTYPYSKLEKGKAIIGSGLAETLSVKKGDTILLNIQTMNSFTGPYRDSHMIALKNRRLTFNGGATYIPVIVEDVANNAYGKYQSTNLENAIIMEYDSLLAHVAEFLNEDLFSKSEKSTLSQLDLYDYASEVYVNYPPNRLTAYNENDYKVIREKITKFASTSMYLMGFNQLSSSFPILEMMEVTQFFALFVGLIISIILIVLCLLSVVLIYSLLMINVENRRYEMGLLRMIGLKRRNLVELILVQAMWYGIPAWILGLIIGQLSYSVVAILLSTQLEANVSYIVSGEAFALATFLGLTVPVLSAILPIKTALGQNLHDSLDTQRSGTAAVKYSIERAEGESISWTSIVMGVVGIIFGFSVYYVMPLSMLTFNITIMMYMFMAVILAMLLGLVLLSLNFENIIEFIVVLFTIRIFEKVSVIDLVEKNLIAHRERNRKTTLMFSLSLGFIIFSSVLFNTQITAFKYNVMRGAGTELIVGTSRLNAFAQNPNIIGTIQEFADNNPNWFVGSTYWTFDLTRVTSPIDNTKIRTDGGLVNNDIYIRAIAPNFFNITNSKFLRIDERIQPENKTVFTKYKSNLDEYLYTVEGSSQLILGTYFKSNLGVNIKDTAVLQITESTSRMPNYRYELFQVGAFLSACPVALYSEFPRFGTQNLLVSVPTYLRLLGKNSNYTATSLPIDAVFLKLTENAKNNKAEFRKLRSTLQRVISPFPGLFIRDISQELDPVEIAVSVMNFFFLFTAAVALVICFFSLISSMYSNINSQAKEIGILRAIGMKKFAIIRVYIYEAFVLISAAAVSGVAIGLAIGQTMAMQNTLITELPIDFVFPYQIVALVLGSAIIFSFFSSFFPIYSLVNMPIVSVLKKLN
ncbi:predicted protein [Naegleria gruberi]|uniref:Predicted protein n=1 Tax=Naegleria gruberi TaxID=5762 RepID=D2VH74_NAEGR|nr:uncharacterized protein NAEGRDRAFT_33972 [Naegleria gruberi]EFC43843.1 predicted protein [Naegleria gruberi]|eukprot:XP_002676587.1 predicted protein [Naegleria gruberi strain NEG-M]